MCISVWVCVCSVVCIREPKWTTQIKIKTSGKTKLSNQSIKTETHPKLLELDTKKQYSRFIIYLTKWISIANSLMLYLANRGSTARKWYTWHRDDIDESGKKQVLTYSNAHPFTNVKARQTKWPFIKIWARQTQIFLSTYSDNCMREDNKI